MNFLIHAIKYNVSASAIPFGIATNFALFLLNLVLGYCTADLGQDYTPSLVGIYVSMFGVFIWFLFLYIKGRN